MKGGTGRWIQIPVRCPSASLDSLYLHDVLFTATETQGYLISRLPLHQPLYRADADCQGQAAPRWLVYWQFNCDQLWKSWDIYCGSTAWKLLTVYLVG